MQPSKHVSTEISPVRSVTMSQCDCFSHDELPGCPEGSNRLQDAVPPQLPQSYVWNHVGLLEGEGTRPAHLWDSAVEAGGLLRPGCDIVWWRHPLLARWPRCGKCEEGKKNAHTLRNKIDLKYKLFYDMREWNSFHSLKSNEESKRFDL